MDDTNGPNSHLYTQMEFETEENAYNWYNEYAKGVGFSIRREYLRKDEGDVITCRRFTCNKEGYRVKDKRTMHVRKPRKETRTGCEARMTIALRSNGKYRIIDFEPRHNHEVVDASIAHILPSQRHISSTQAREIELADDSGIRPKLAFELLSRQAGGRENLGFIHQDQRNLLRNKRKEDTKYGEVGSIMNYFEKQSLENPSFFYAFDTDEENRVTNIFWADSKMILDYNLFGDVVFFDSTYRTNKICRPFGSFVGLNHHFQQVVFGACLLYDETKESFIWLFKTFLKCMSGKIPISFFTDQDPAMLHAIPIVMPETNHRLCIWHILYNAAKHSNRLFKSSKIFLKDFRKCIYDCEDEEEFLKSWESMLSLYDMSNNDWLKGLFNVKEKWAMVYGREHFSAGKHSTQLCESFNSHLKNYLKSDMDLVQFLKHFERALYDRRYNEKLANYNMIQKVPILKVNVPFLKHARDNYTEKIFDLSQLEYEKSLLMVIDACIQDGPVIRYKVSTFGHSKQFTVCVEILDLTVNCCCKNFEFAGFLCSHATKVLDELKIKIEVPEKYILKRWTKNARVGSDIEVGERDVINDPKLEMNSRFKKLCSTYLKIASKSLDSKEAMDFLEKTSVETNSKLEEILKITLVEEYNCTRNAACPDDLRTSSAVNRPKELKKREIERGGNKRYKNCFEKGSQSKGKSTQDPKLATKSKKRPSKEKKSNGQSSAQIITTTEADFIGNSPTNNTYVPQHHHAHIPFLGNYGDYPVFDSSGNYGNYPVFDSSILSTFGLDLVSLDLNLSGKNNHFQEI